MFMKTTKSEYSKFVESYFEKYEGDKVLCIKNFAAHFGVNFVKASNIVTSILKEKNIETSTCICILNVSSSDKKFNTNQVFINKTKKDLFYFNENLSELFSIISFNWDGPNYTTYSITKGGTNTVGKSKRTGRILGAAIGTAIAPGIGTVIGAAHGTGNKKVGMHSDNTSITQERQSERPSLAKLTIKYKDSNTTESFTFKCLKSTADILNDLCKSKGVSKSNYINDIKGLKELLDLGAITQAEYDDKKSELLNKI